MENKKGQNIYRTIMLIVLAVTITYIITALRLSNKISNSENSDIVTNISSNQTLNFSELKAILEKKYIGDIDDQKLLEGAIKGYVEGTGDPYTTYLTEKEMQELTEETSGKYVGIGIYVTENKADNTILIIGVMNGSPALESGIQAGDIIKKVDDVEYTGSQLSEAVSKLKGEENTKVNVMVLRDEKEINMEVTRKSIIVEHVTSKVINDNIGYIQLDSFDDNVAEEFEKQYKSLKESNITGLIIDLRNNGGGVVDEATAIADLFSEKGETVLITKGKTDEEELTKAKREKVIKDVPVVVLINQATASASEILAGALRDNYGAIIVGKNSYGKGVIQTVYSLSNGAGLKITTNEYFTPKHVKINEIGIKPDEEIELTINSEGYYETSEDKDTQLLKAIEVIKSKQ